MPDNSIGLYIHIPFCVKKCRYCDFYSVIPGERVYKDYLDALLREIKKWGGRLNRPVSTLYIGGGTPSVLGEDIKVLIDAVRKNFILLPDAEITAECNPNLDFEFLDCAKSSGVNRLSFGIQSGNDERLKTLGRNHTADQAKKAVAYAREIGFDNISCDIMISLPESNLDTLSEDIDFICSLSPDHISAYILKIEENTAFYKQRETLNLPDEDNTAEQYSALCRELEKRGYEHYEISNFALKGKKSRHNLKYWHCEEYIGIGPSAHSFSDGKRFYYKRDIKDFINGGGTLPDGEGGTLSERIMLGLRLNDGVDICSFGKDGISKIERLKGAGLVESDGKKIRLTDKGMLLSNSIITELLYEDF